MKKIKNFFKKNVRLFVGILIGGVLVGGSVYAATIIGAGEVSYTNNSQTSVQSALDDLYTLSNTWINPIYINFGTLDTNVKQTILASSDGVCLKRNGKVSCFKSNNWNVEKNHIKEVFSDVGAWNDSTRTGCNDYSSGVYCADSDFSCAIDNVGIVHCTDLSDNSDCYSYGNGTVECGKVKVDGVENVGFQTNTAKTVFANSSGVCITRKRKTSCFKINNWAVEKDHIQQVFSDVGTYNGSTGLGCYVDSSYVYCGASDFGCGVYSNGYVICNDQSDSSSCDVRSSGVGCN